MVMPPRAKQYYTYQMPVNQKWIKSDQTPTEVRNEPEFNVRFSETFDMLYTSVDMENEARWTETQARGDFDKTQGLRPFAAANYFRGKGAPAGRFATTAALVPADPPLISGGIRLGISVLALSDLNSCAVPPRGWPSSVKEKMLLMEKFPPLNIEWNLRGVLGSTYVEYKDAGYYTLESGLRMEPGYGYIFSATLSVIPSYEVDTAGIEHLKTWTTRADDLGAVRYKLPEGQNNLVKYTYSISFDESQHPVYSLLTYELIDLLTNIGAICCLAYLAENILFWANRVSGEAAEQHQRQEEHLAAMNAVLHLSSAYLDDLRAYCSQELGIEKIATVIGTNRDALVESDWTSFKVRTELGLALTTPIDGVEDGSTVLLCLQLCLQLFHRTRTEPSLGPKYEQIKEAFTSYWTARSQEGVILHDSISGEAVWKSCWPILGENLMEKVLLEIMEEDKVDRMLGKGLL